MTNHYRYIIFYKPYGVLCQFTKDAPTHSTLKDYIDVPDVYPVGRLDWDSEGLLLLTNDGQLQHRLAHPRFGHKRTYWVQVERIPDADAIKRLQTGVEIQDYRTQPAEVRLLPQEPQLPERNPPIRFRKNIPTAWLEMTLTEGKNRQVRRMTAAVGFPTLRLVRVSIAHLQLDNLQLGQWRDLTTSELQFLHNFSKLKSFPPKTNNPKLL
ncbi:MAG: rRNA large subunit pseudouridine synthase E [Nostoc sp. CmiVER01]|uniref:rRNA large subunit pseudouridine synthase E n=1 Tax=Nostoc sp. CmiVER01 TaxID=3075384 RepID=UPI002AD2C1DC|nr:rRNA large subunit pseudouridine synthase E [Nostoc sp. CmiVER01]MDZ8120628.1 rRNA large subunit pseudouridine synthase E [Nostoc sp. CmiVER01]